jgi:hypothetical protein
LVRKKNEQVRFARKFRRLRADAPGKRKADRTERGSSNKFSTRKFRVHGAQSLDALRDLQSAFAANPQSGNLLFAREQNVETRFAPISRIAVNDPAFGRLVERRNQGANFLRVRFHVSASSFLERTQSRSDTAILLSALERLAGTFRC